MCGKLTQHSSWQQVHAFSQPLVIKANDQLVVSTPMRPAYISRRREIPTSGSDRATLGN